MELSVWSIVRPVFFYLSQPPAVRWRRLGVLIASVFLSLPVMGARPGETVPVPECSELLDGLRTKLEANYAGFHLEVVGARRAAYTEMLSPLGEQAAQVDRDGCLVILQQYIEWFDDPHIFLYQSTNLSDEETDARRASVPRIDVEETTVLADLASRATVDPIEGIWADLGMRIAVVPDLGQTAGNFVAVVTKSDATTLPVGAVRARLQRRDDGSYSVSLRSRSLAETVAKGTIHRRSILRLSPGMWGKVAPIPPAMVGLIDPTDVHRPTLTVRGDVVIVSVPSHDPRLTSVLDSLIQENQASLRSARTLIVDLRGNEGGGSMTTAKLLPFLMDSDPTPRSHELGRRALLSSPDQISYASRSFGPPTTAFVRRLVTAMEAAPGELVPMADPDQPPSPQPEVTPIYGPRRAALLVDSGTVSAAEVLVQEVQRSARTLVIGSSTAGALDYQNTSIVRIATGENHWFLGYPTIAAHPNLPKGGMRGKGIAPDVVVDWATTEDPFELAKKILTEGR